MPYDLCDDDDTLILVETEMAKRRRSTCLIPRCLHTVLVEFGINLSEIFCFDPTNASSTDQIGSSFVIGR